MSTATSSLLEATLPVQKGDYLLIVAAAGLSISTTLPNNPYHSNSDFAQHYPRMRREFGYENSFQAMSLAQDPNVPAAVKAAFGARHFLNMTERFPPTEGYTALRRLADTVGDDHVFCWTSNVDRCFARSGFPTDRVYPCQGEMNRYQCTRCDLVWTCTEDLKRIDSASGGDNLELTDINLALKCPKCGQRDQLFPNLRGGSWFNHHPYEALQDDLINFLSQVMTAPQGTRLTVIEVGVGANTPIVTAIPASRFATAAATNGKEVQYLRVNPDRHCHRYAPDPSALFAQVKTKLLERGGDEKEEALGGLGSLRYTHFPTSWEVLRDLAEHSNSSSASTPLRVAAAAGTQTSGNTVFAQQLFDSAVHSLFQLR